MKNFTLIIFLCLLSLVGYAQDGYDKFVVEGKTWTIFHYPMVKEYQYIYKMELKGDTVINNIDCKKLYRCSDDGTSYVGAMREDGGKVYFKEKSSNEVCLYDFGLNVGDVFTGIQGNVSGKLDVISKDYKDFLGKERLTLNLNQEEYNVNTTQWISGIGGPSSPECNYMMVGNCDNLLVCSVNNDTIYLNSELSVIANIRAAKITESESRMYDLSGRQLTSEPQKGIYIKGKRKYIVGNTPRY